MKSQIWIGFVYNSQFIALDYCLTKPCPITVNQPKKIKIKNDNSIRLSPKNTE